MATRAEVIERVYMNGFATDQMGESCRAYYVRVDDFYGLDYIWISDEWGRSDLEVYEHVDIDADGYFCPVERAWQAYAAEVYAGEDDE